MKKTFGKIRFRKSFCIWGESILTFLIAIGKYGNSFSHPLRFINPNLGHLLKWNYIVTCSNFSNRYPAQSKIVAGCRDLIKKSFFYLMQAANLRFGKSQIAALRLKGVTQRC